MGEVRTTGGKEYTFGKKLGAFGRGLPRLKPFLRIAEEGLQRGYSLGARKEEAYLIRIRNSVGGYMRMAQLFGPQMPDRMQRELAKDLSFHVRYIPVQSESARVRGERELASRLADKMFNLRQVVAEALYTGRVTSVKAQLILAECFSEQSVDKRSAQLDEVRHLVLLPASQVSEEFKEKLREIAGEQEGMAPPPAA